MFGIRGFRALGFRGLFPGFGHHLFHGLGGLFKRFAAGNALGDFFVFFLNISGLLGRFNFSLEFVYPAGSVYEFHFSSEKGMAGSTNFYLDMLFGRSGGEAVPTGAGDLGVIEILRMSVCFHTWIF